MKSKNWPNRADHPLKPLRVKYLTFKYTTEPAKSSSELTQGANEITKNMSQLDQAVLETSKSIAQVSKQAGNKIN